MMQIHVSINVFAVNLDAAMEYSITCTDSWNIWKPKIPKGFLWDSWGIPYDLELNECAYEWTTETRFACCRCDTPDCTSTFGKSLIPSSEAPIPTDILMILSWVNVRMNRRNEQMKQGLHVARLTLQIVPKPMENHWFRALMFWNPRNINASDLDERAYEWTFGRGRLVACSNGCLWLGCL